MKSGGAGYRIRFPPLGGGGHLLSGGIQPSVGPSVSSLRTFKCSMMASRSSDDRSGPITPCWGSVPAFHVSRGAVNWWPVL
jgi:hypothetical protein